MPTIQSSLDGRTLHLSLDVQVTPRVSSASHGSTDAAHAMAKQIELEVGLLAKRMAGDGYAVKVGADIKVY